MPCSTTFRAAFGVGSTQGGNHAAPTTTTEQDFVANVTPAAAVAGVAAFRGISVAPAVVDGTTTTTVGVPRKLWLNAIINTADETVATTPANLILDGVITLEWELLGDM